MSSKEKWLDFYQSADIKKYMNSLTALSQKLIRFSITLFSTVFVVIDMFMIKKLKYS